MKHSQPCAQGFLHSNKLETEVLFAVFDKAECVLKLFDTEEAGGEAVRNGSL